MPEYIDREALLQEISKQKAASKHSFPRRSFVVGDVIACIRTAPAADVAPVVLCKNCKYSTPPSAMTQLYGEPGTLTCHYGPCNRRNVNENDFCSYGEKMDGDAGE